MKSCNLSSQVNQPLPKDFFPSEDGYPEEFHHKMRVSCHRGQLVGHTQVWRMRGRDPELREKIANMAIMSFVPCLQLWKLWYPPKEVICNRCWCFCLVVHLTSHRGIKILMPHDTRQKRNLQHNHNMLISQKAPVGSPGNPRGNFPLTYNRWNGLPSRSVLPSKCRSPTRSRCIGTTRASNNASRISGWDRWMGTTGMEDWQSHGPHGFLF